MGDSTSVQWMVTPISTALLGLQAVTVQKLPLNFIASCELSLYLHHFYLQQGEILHSEVEYAVQRLVRGLASSRKGARQGYYIALTEVSVCRKT